MDIVDRLRGDYGVPVPFKTTPICHEAADEIERLRLEKEFLLEALRRIADEEDGLNVYSYAESVINEINEIKEDCDGH